MVRDLIRSDVGRPNNMNQASNLNFTRARFSATSWIHRLRVGPILFLCVPLRNCTKHHQPPIHPLTHPPCPHPARPWALKSPSQQQSSPNRRNPSPPPSDRKPTRRNPSPPLCALRRDPRPPNHPRPTTSRPRPAPSPRGRPLPTPSPELRPPTNLRHPVLADKERPRRRARGTGSTARYRTASRAWGITQGGS